MTISINYDEMTATSMELGHIGEHNATTLEVTWTNSDERVASYRVAFQTGGKSVLSDSYYSMPIEVALWQQLTLNPRMSIQIIAYDSEGDYIGKSEKFSGFYFAPSVQSNEAAADTDQHDIGAELSRVETTVADHEERIDALEAKTEIYAINGTKTGYEWFNLYKTAVLKYKGNEIIGAKYDSSSKVATFYFYENGILGEGYFRITVDASKSIGEDLTPQGNIHLHENKAVIDKFSYEDGKLLYDGEEIGGGTITDVQDEAGQSLVSEGIATIPSEVVEIIRSYRLAYTPSEVETMFRTKELKISGKTVVDIYSYGTGVSLNTQIYFIDRDDGEEYLYYNEYSNNGTAISTRNKVGRWSEANYTSTEKTKLNGIATGAEVNVIDTIKDSNGNPLTVTSKAVTLPAIPAAQIQSDWEQSDNTAKDYIKNKPSIPAAQVQADWNESDNTKADYIKNKPTIPDISGKEDTANKVTSLSSSSKDTEYPSAKCVYDELQSIPSMPSGTNAGDILVWDGDEWVSKPKWQMIYQPVEYIESTGTQRIRTGVFAGPTTRLVADMQFTEQPPSNSAFLNGATNGTWGFIWGWEGLTNTNFRTIINSSYQWKDASQGDTDRHIWDLANGSQKIDNVEYSTTSMTAVSTNYDITFGSRYSNGNFNTPSKAKYYSVKVYDGNTLIRDFVPAYNIYTGETGCYETVEQKFYGNGGSGNFILGPEI